MQFTIKEHFYLDNQPLQIRSGSVHYFRIQPSQWETTLINLKRVGFNTVETYIPWNCHEPQEGNFNFRGLYDVQAFVRCAQQVGLYVLLRPSPYICAEWEFGGLPSWLLKTPMRLRSSDPIFLKKVLSYYNELLPRLVPLQVTHGGPILMMQVENEYGSYGEDKGYLVALARMLRNGGVDVPLFTSDGTWDEALSSGNMADVGILTTGNFGSHANENFDALAAFHQAHGRQWPLMCMEYWDGWFNRWGVPVIRRPLAEFASDVETLLRRGNINLYMFRGGTNFGFMNGVSSEAARNWPQVTSYDYDAPLTEWGAPTPKYFVLQQIVHKIVPDAEQNSPIVPKTTAYGSVIADGYCDLLEHADAVAEVRQSLYPESFEQLNQSTGYVLYRTVVKNYPHEQQLTLRDVHDRVQIFVEGKLIETQMYEEVGMPVPFSFKSKKNLDVEILVESLGRINYGPYMDGLHQHKGVIGGVMIDHQFRLHWRQYALRFDKKLATCIPFKETQPRSNRPRFIHFSLDIKGMPINTFIDCSQWGKGCVLVNGVNIGRYWDRGPIHSLYVPDSLLKAHNEIIVFETEPITVDMLSLVAAPVIDEERK